MTDTIIHYSITRPHDTHAKRQIYAHTHTFSLPLFLAVTRTYIKSFIDSLTTLFHPSIFQQRVKESWRMGGMKAEQEEKVLIEELQERKPAERHRESDAIITNAKKPVHRNTDKMNARG